MSSTKDKIKLLTRQLYPTGRAFNIPVDSNIEKLHSGLGESEAEAYNDAFAILDSILADNANFTTDDATDWETRLGLITNPLVSLADRKAAILRKYNHPGDIPARQSWDYLQQSLQDAGFDVYVHENIPEKTILEVLALNPLLPQHGNGQMGDFQHGSLGSYYSSLLCELQHGDVQMGDAQHGQTFFKQTLANNIEAAKDIYFDIGLNQRSIFFVGGATLGEFADVDVNRRDEFRQLILKIKPAQSIGILLINYI